jgi:hypothetical protein
MSNEHNLLGKVWFSGPFGLSPVTFGRENPNKGARRLTFMLGAGTPERGRSGIYSFRNGPLGSRRHRPGNRGPAGGG